MLRETHSADAGGVFLLDHPGPVCRTVRSGHPGRLVLKARVIDRVAFGLALLVAGSLAGPSARAQSTRPARALTPLAAIEVTTLSPPPATQPLEHFPEIRAAVDEARALLEQGRAREALAALDGVAAEPGGNRYEVHYLLARIQVALGQLEAARQSAQTAATLNPHAVDAHYLLGRLEQQRGAHEAAIAHFRAATLAAESEPDNPRGTLAWYQLGRTLSWTGYDLAAAQAYEQFDRIVWELKPQQRQTPELSNILAGRSIGTVPERLRLLRKLGRTAEACAVAEWARQHWPEDPFVERAYAQSLLLADRAEQAWEFCQQQLARTGAARNLAGVALEAARVTGRLEDWLAGLIRAVRDGQQLELARELLRSLNAAGLVSHAARLGQALLEQQPGVPGVAWQLALAERNSGDLPGALRTLITFVRSTPDLAELPQHWLQQWRHWLTPDVDLDRLVRELRGEPGADFATDFILGVSALAADRLALADELLRSALAARPDFICARVVQGQMLLATYQWDAAKAHARSVLDQAPDAAGAWYVLAEAHDGLDENEAAEQAYKHAIRLRPDEPAYTLALAMHYRRLGNLRGAQRYFQQTLANDPTHGAALEGLIDCYVLGNKLELARAQLERADDARLPPDTRRRVRTLLRYLSAPFGPEHLAELKTQFAQHPDDVATARYLAGGLYQRGRLDEAHAVVSRALRVAPEDFHLRMLLVNIHAQREEFDAAIEQLEELVKRFPNRRSVLEPLALYCVYDFRFEEGRPALHRLLELEDDPLAREEYRRTLRDSYLVLGQFDEALRLVEQWLKDSPDDDSLLWHRALVLLEAGRNQEAFATLRTWFEHAPDDPERRERLYRVGIVTRQYEPTLALIHEWLAQDPNSARLTEWLVDVLLAAGRADEALEVARTFRARGGEEVLRRLWLGRSQLAAGRVDEALAEFDALLAERTLDDSQRREVWNTVAESLLRAGCVEPALERIEHWLSEAEALGATFRPLALHWKRSALQLAGRDRESAAVMEELLEYVPVLEVLLNDSSYNAGLFNDLGYVWADLGMNLDRAAALIRQAVAADPWNAAFVDSLGWVYYKMGDFAKAHRYLSRAARLRAGQDPVVYDHLADASYRLGDREAARRYWQQALNLVEQAEHEADAGPTSAETMQLPDRTAAAVRAKLAALERGEPPPLAPTAHEQNPSDE